MTASPAIIARAAHVASERAATALSELVGQPLTPETQVAEEGADAEKDLVVTRFDVQGWEKSTFLAAFSADSLRAVQEMLAPGMGDSPEARDMVAREVGNICVSHFLNSLGDLIHLPLLPSPPGVAHPPPRPETEYVIHTDFKAASGGRIHGTLRFLPDAKLVEAIRRAGGS